MTSEYIAERNGGYYIAGARIFLDSIVYSFKRGNLPETIQKVFPLLRQPQIRRNCLPSGSSKRYSPLP